MSPKQISQTETAETGLECGTATLWFLENRTYVVSDVFIEAKVQLCHTLMPEPNYTPEPEGVELVLWLRKPGRLDFIMFIAFHSLQLGYTLH